MKTESPEIDRERLARLISREYALDVRRITFLPKGEDACSYIAEDGGGRRSFVRVQSGAEAETLDTALAAAHILHAQAGLTQVVAAHETVGGRLTCRLGRSVVAVFPFLSGKTACEEDPSDQELAQAAALLAALHMSDPTLMTTLSLPQEQFANPFEARVARLLHAVEGPDPTGTAVDPAASERRQARDLLRAEREDIRGTLDRMRRLQREALAWNIPHVLTHGDPNLDNLVRDGHGLVHLVDWGEVAFGPPERDLMAFTGGRFETFLSAYLRAWQGGGRPESALHPVRFEFYFYRWALQEIADYAGRLLLSNPSAPERRHALTELRDYLPIRHAHIALEFRVLEKTLARLGVRARG